METMPGITHHHPSWKPTPASSHLGEGISLFHFDIQGLRFLLRPGSDGCSLFVTYTMLSMTQWSAPLRLRR
jgi:hypothetical protein